MRLRSLFIICAAVLLLASVALGAAGAYQSTKDGKTTVWNSNPRPGESADWSGKRDSEGYATGFGTLTWFNAKGTVYARYYGNVVRGKLNGPVNVHSKGKTGHAYFVEGERSTPWATGPAPLRMVAPERAEPAKKQEVATEKPETPAARKKENVQLRKDSRAGSSTTVERGRLPNSERIREQGAQHPNEEAAAAKPETPAGKQKPEVSGQPPSPSSYGEPRRSGVSAPASNSESVREQASQPSKTDRHLAETPEAEPQAPAEKGSKTKTSEHALLAPGEVRPIEHVVRRSETIHEGRNKWSKSAKAEKSPSVDARHGQQAATSGGASANSETAPAIEPTPIAAAAAREVTETPRVEETVRAGQALPGDRGQPPSSRSRGTTGEPRRSEGSNRNENSATSAPGPNATARKEVDDSLKSLVAPPSSLRSTPAPSPSETPE